MNLEEKGTRVVAIMDTVPSEKVVRIFGYGTYNGDKKLPPEKITLIGTEKQVRDELTKLYLGKPKPSVKSILDRDKLQPEDREIFDKEIAEEEAEKAKGEFIYKSKDIDNMVHRSRMNPHISLDEGKEVWGCECWWCPIKQFEQNYQNWTIVLVNINQEREKVKQESGSLQ